MAGKNKVPASHDRRLILAAFLFFGSFLMPGRTGSAPRSTSSDLLRGLQSLVRRPRVQSADLHRHHDGVLVQDAFPYLPPEYRELLISGTCPGCWAVLCSSNPLAYSQVICEECEKGESHDEN